MRLFPTYGNNEPSHRLLPLLKKAALAGKDFIIKNPCEIRDFTNVNYASNVVLDDCNFKKNKFEGFRIYHISQNRPVTVGKFAKKHWNIYKSKGKLIFKNKRSLYTKHVSDHSSLWKL
jgi:nucleoside-diphosphate-sugar epimerase